MPFFEEWQIHPFFRKNPAARRRFIGLVGCGKKKTTHPAEARKLYTGGLTRMSIEWMDRNCETFFVLSAKYHLVPSDARIKPYELKISDLDEDDRVAWGQLVASQLKRRVGFDKPFIIMAGNDYIQALNAGLAETHATIFDPCPKMKMGLRMNWIRTHPVLTKEVVEEIKHRG